MKTNEGKYVYSPRSPLKAAERTISGFKNRDFNTMVAVGFGLGYHLAALSKTLRDDQFLVVVEPRSELFAVAIKLVRLSEVFSRKNTLFLIGDITADHLNRLTGYINPLRVKKIESFRHPSLY